MIEMIQVSKSEFERWKSLDTYNHSQVFMNADCQNFYNASGEVIAKHSFGGSPEIFRIRKDYYHVSKALAHTVEKNGEALAKLKEDE